MAGGNPSISWDYKVQVTQGLRLQPLQETPAGRPSKNILVILLPLPGPAPTYSPQCVCVGGALVKAGDLPCFYQDQTLQ